MAVNTMSRAFRALPFWDRVAAQTKVADSGCHEFMGNRDECGYGRISNGTRNVRLHRSAWERENGSIPEGMVVMHKCDNPCCINTDHLRIGTQADNIDDMSKKGRRVSLRGSQQTQAKLDEQKVRQIVESVLCGKTVAQLARDLCVSESAIRNVTKGRRWVHVTGYGQ